MKYYIVKLTIIISEYEKFSTMAVEAKNEHEALLTAINNERHNELIEENNCYTEQCGTFSYCKDWIKPITKEQYAQFENIISPPY